MKRLLVSAAAIVAAMGLMAPANAGSVAVATQEGPYGPVKFQDYGTCGDVWANITQKTTYYVPKKSADGSYKVRFDIAGPFTSMPLIIIFSSSTFGLTSNAVARLMNSFITKP